MSENYSVYYCDTETTGLDPVKNDVIEVCFWRMGDEESRTWRFKPLNPESIDDRALKVNGHLREDILGLTAFGRETYLDPREVLPEIEAWIMEDGCSATERVFVGQNPDFDYEFLFNLWKKCDYFEEFPFGFWRNGNENVGFTLDTIQIARFIDLLLGKKRRFYNLGSLVKSFGIKKAQAHRADGDVQMTKELFEKMMKGFADAAKNFSDCYEKSDELGSLDDIEGSPEPWEDSDEDIVENNDSGDL